MRNEQTTSTGRSFVEERGCSTVEECGRSTVEERRFSAAYYLGIVDGLQPLRMRAI